MNVYKTVIEVIEGVEKEFVMIELNEYNHYMNLTNPLYEKIAAKEKKVIEKEQKQEDIERRRIEKIEERDRREKEEEINYQNSIKSQIMINKHHNDKIKKIKEDLLEDYKEVFNTNKNAKIQKCDFCENYLVYPIHYFNENNEKYMREYTQDKKKCKSPCCMDCFQTAEQKKEERKLDHTEYCHICQSSFIALTDNAITMHFNSTKHKKNETKKNNINNGSKLKLELLPVKELQKICSNSINDDGTYRINNYTKIKKAELIEKMNSIYDMLKFD